MIVNEIFLIESNKNITKNVVQVRSMNFYSWIYYSGLF
ncbi:hypothetical protein MCERE19_03762 [Spirosomataceae bacterium]